MAPAMFCELSHENIDMHVEIVVGRKRLREENLPLGDENQLKRLKSTNESVTGGDMVIMATKSEQYMMQKIPVVR